ncbi:winged helix-turn-helix transcriptional regulator [Halobellus rufus]|uniref:winged helix-turn-helix transcriptional regulator n=1 Tax=Halobellus rufus TaxID=1448860 RepID=UPI0006789860|nr:helix-turn-helix domain-containing protein [Halobellus rufus]
MAIPTWLSDPDAFGPRSISAAEVDGVSETLDVLASPPRLEILAVLHRRSDPIRYSALREELSIDDKGRLNYHLRQLDGIVTREEGRYALTERGEELVEAVAAADARDSK